MPHHPESIGAYKILDVLGEGGMGVVYAAEQTEPVRRRVALKVIKLGMDTKEVLARFEAERQALAMLDHPNIAKVLEAGATAEGRPYFAMEMVRGVGITKYCDIEQATIAQRLSLVLQACAALQHAHERGILHRDVKPTNMLVSEVDGAPMVKVIDFGLAKAMNQQLTERTLFTEAGRLLGTPEYMSPEQADLTALEVDQRTDVYSLGVTLYELLAGALPFDAQRMRAGGYPEIQRLIKEEEPPTPSQRLSRLKNGVEEIARLRNCRLRELSGSLRRGLDAVVMKALSKRRQDRYASCAELAADIERFLRGEPVLAKPAGFVGRWTAKVRRFHKRYPVLPAVALVTAVMLFVLRDPAATVADDPAPVGGKRFDGTMSGMGEEGDFVVYSRDAWRALPPHESVLGARVRADEEFEGAVFAIQVDDCGGREQILQALWKRQGAAMAEDKGDIDHHWIVGRKSLFFGLDERFDASTHKGVLKILLLVGDRLDAGLLEQQVRFVLRRMARLHGLKPEDVGLNGKHVDLVARMIRDFEASRQQPSQNDADILAIVDVPRSQSLLEPIITSRAEPMGTVTMITLHHSAMPSPRSRRGALAQALAMQTTHVTQNKWADIGYHFLIDGEGRIHEARPLCYQGASAGAVNNEGSIGICLLGNYAKGARGQRLLPNQEAALARLIDSLRVRFAVPPSACVGHSELKETECPGPEPLEWLKRYRQEAARQGGK